MGAWVAGAAFLAACTMTLAAQRAYEVPDSTVEHTGDAGVRAHTNHLILLRPSHISEARGGTSKTAAPPVGETPGSLGCVYQTSGASLSTGCPITGELSSGNDGLPTDNGGKYVIAIVDAYNYPTAAADLKTFSSEFDLNAPAACTMSGNDITSESACFTTVYASGKEPAGNSSWALEEALDIEWSHAMAPGANVVLVEAASDSYSDLFTAVQKATAIVEANGGGEVSMSWGGSEFSGETAYDTYFETTTEPVVYFAAAGDSGGTTEYPSVSPYVVSAGGTSVNRSTAGAFESETTWTDGGGGASKYEKVPSYQTDVENLVGTHRGTPDESFDANPNTGVFVYDSTPYDGESGWWLVGGTSVATPSLAGITNLQGTFRDGSAAQLAAGVYDICTSDKSTACVNATLFRDITSGTAGHYSAATGWDFTTGVGSNLGLTGH